MYYNFDSAAEEPTVNFYEYGFQNSRGFRALKVWMALQQIGKSGYIELIGKDITLAQLLYEEARKHPDLEAVTQSLSITTLRYVPSGHAPGQLTEEYLNQLNEQLLNELQRSGEVFLSNAVVEGKYCLRACLVNFRTTAEDIEETVRIISESGRRAHELLFKH